VKKSATALTISILIVAIMLMVALLALSTRTESFSDSRFCMDTICTITTYGSGKRAASSAISEAWDSITALENRISATLPYSDICRINSLAGSGQWVEVSQQTYDSIAFALQMGDSTEGALNCALGSVISLWGIGTDSAKVPSQDEIDALLPSCTTANVLLKTEGSSFLVQITDADTRVNLGAVGKGIAADLARDILKEHGIKSATIDFGGNLYVIGRMPTTLGHRPFRIGLQDPDENRGGYFMAVSVMDKSVVTSGSYERKLVADDGHVYSHIIDPSTGWSIENDILSVSLIGPSSSVCDALSTALFVLGPEGGEKLLSESFRDYLAVFLIADGGERSIVRVGNQDVLQ